VFGGVSDANVGSPTERELGDTSLREIEQYGTQSMSRSVNGASVSAMRLRRQPAVVSRADNGRNGCRDLTRLGFVGGVGWRRGAREMSH